MSINHKPLIIHEQVRNNQIKTAVLIALYIIVIFIIGFTIGYYNDSMVLGIGLSVFVVCVLLPIQMLTGNKMVGKRTNWSEVNMSAPGENRVYHLVEGLSIAAGMKDMPKLYILPSKIPNAFAGGLSLDNSYICVTRGLIELLDEPEMEGVLAHEMSHIIQRDVLVSTVSVYLMSAAIILGGILFRTFRYNMFSGGGSRNRRSSKNSGNSAAAFAVIALAGIILSIAIRLVANLINLAISRKREYIADANAVRLCGYSSGIADALEKISTISPEYSNEQIEELGGSEMLCLYIFNPSSKINSLFSTHPPIEERIKLLRNMY